MRLPLAIGYYAGMRRAEVMGLRWEQVNFMENTIVLLPGETKNNQGRTIPVVPQLRTLLVEQRTRRQEGCPYVCFRLDRRGHAAKIGRFRRVWQSRCVKLGLGKMEPIAGAAVEVCSDRPHGKPKPKMIYCGMLYHDLRRTFVRNLVKSGTPEKVSMKFSGHLSRQVFDRYQISTDKDVLEAGERLAAYLEKTGTTLHQNAAGSSAVN